jgi:hypothetical protein
MFTEIYNWFTEGFDTADLLQAKPCSTRTEHNPPTLTSLQKRAQFAGTFRDDNRPNPSAHRTGYMPGIEQCDGWTAPC